MEYKNLIFQIENNIATITFNRPKALNSLNHEMIHSVQKTLDEAKENRDIRVVLFYGEGKLGFSPAVGTLTHRSSSNP